MIAAIHQPNYLPWMGYFHKALAADRLVLLDTVGFSKGSYTNRCRIRRGQGAGWLTVPVRTAGRLGQPIKETALEGNEWSRRHLAVLREAYEDCPYFESYFPALEDALSTGGDLLAELNRRLIALILGWLEIETELIWASDLASRGRRTELLVGICRELGADAYLSGQGARTYNEEEAFRQAGMRLVYDDFSHPLYDQGAETFIPGLSILDLLFNCGDGSRSILEGRKPARAEGRGALSQVKRVSA